MNDFSRALRYFDQTLTQQAIGNILAMSSKEFELFSQEFNKRSGATDNRKGSRVIKTDIV